MIAMIKGVDGGSYLSLNLDRSRTYNIFNNAVDKVTSFRGSRV